MITDRKIIIWTAIILLLVAGNVSFGMKYVLEKKESEKLQQELQQKRTNQKIINFLDIFIQKVLRSNKEVSFEDRLKLENAIRDINDPEILSKWEEFTKGTNEAQIQQGVKNLLEILVKKIS